MSMVGYMRFKLAILSAALALGYGAAASAAAINTATYSKVGRVLADFEDVPAVPFPGTSYNGVLVSGGAQFGERFVGQTLSYVIDPATLGFLDVLSGAPTGPLTLAFGLPGQNLAVGTDNTHDLLGCGRLGCADPNGYGEGAVAVLFSGGVSYFGFQQLFSGPAKLTTLDFFNSAGGLIQRLTVNSTQESVAFAREGGVKDIAGVSIFTADAGGLAYDNFVFDTPAVTGGAVPEPAAWALMIGGFGMAGAMLRRRRAAA